MKKVCFGLMALVAFAGLFIPTAEGAQLCWQVDFPDRPLLNGYASLMASAGTWTRGVHGVWYIQGSTYWPVAGNMIKTADGAKWYLQLNTTYMGGDYVGMVVTLDNRTFSGDGVFSEISTDVATFAMTFTKISCKSMPAYVAP